MPDEATMRDELVGYLLNALDEGETRRVEQALADPHRGPALRDDLDTLRQAIKPLAFDRESIDVPAGLAARTLQFVATQTAAAPEHRGPKPTPRSFSPAADEIRGPAGRRWLDRLIIGATAVAACVLVAPLLLESIEESRQRRVDRNLQRVSTALQGYAESHGMYPTPPNAGPLSRAGLYAPTLVAEERIVANDGTLLVPDSAMSRRGGFKVPTLAELEAAVGTPQFDELVKTMGGDFGYTLGHRDQAGELQPNINRRRADHPILADAPDACCEKSSNHPGGIHHVLFEDGRVVRWKEDALHRDDHLYRNHQGKVAAGVDAEDAVIGDSHHQP
jgi:hypothetical protein